MEWIKVDGLPIDYQRKYTAATKVEEERGREGGRERGREGGREREKEGEGERRRGRGRGEEGERGFEWSGSELMGCQ